MEKLKKRLGFLLICLSCVYLLLRIFGIMDQHFHFKSLTAYAEDVVLTPQQTAALLGSSFPVTYHNSQTNIELSMSATLIGTTDDFDLYNGTGSGSNFAMPFFYANSGHQNAIAPYNYTKGLVYSVTFLNVDDFVTSNSNAFFNFRNDFSISLNGITRFEMPIFWGATRNGQWANRSAYNVNTSNGLVSGEGLHSNAAGYPYYQSYVFKSEDVNEDYNAAVADRMYFNCFPIDLQSESEFSVSGITCGYNNCQEYNLIDDSIYTGYFYIIIECPVISNFNPVTTPAATSAVTTTRAPYTGDYQITTAQFTYDLSPLETNQLNQIRIENEILNYTAGVFDGVNIIIQQLNDIYNRMVQQGQIPVNLINAEPLHTLDSDFRANVVNNLTSYTTARIPEAGGAYEMIHSLYYRFTSGSFEIFAIIGGLSLALLVLDWFLFHGRGG